MTIFKQTVLAQVKTQVTIEPVRNVLWGMSLLTADADILAAEPWLAETAVRLTLEQQKNNQLVFQGLGGALLPDEPVADFPAYLELLRSETATTLLARLASYPNPRATFDDEQVEALENYLDHPERMKGLIISHLTELWDGWFAQLWQKKIYMMNTVVPNLQSRPWPTDSAAVAIQAFIKRDVPELVSLELKGVDKVVFCPSPYMQLQAARFGSDDTVWVFVYADPWVLPMRYEPIQRSEVLRLLNALNDETRLQMLERLVVEETVRGQAFIDYLEVSQPTVSRHVKILKNSQWITEKRSGADASKLYQINKERLATFYFLLQTLLSEANAREVLQDVRSGFPAVLRPFLNTDGLVVTWPSKRKPQQAILQYLADKIGPDQEYSEKELTQLLDGWLVHVDSVHMRRELIDWKYLVRTASGSHYWKGAS